MKNDESLLSAASGIEPVTAVAKTVTVIATERVLINLYLCATAIIMQPALPAPLFRLTQVY